MRNRQTLLRRIDIGLGLASVAAIAYAATRLPAAGAWGWGALAAAALAVVLATPVAIVVGRRDHRMVLDTPVLLPAVLLLPGTTAVLATVVGVALGSVHRLRREGRPVVAITVRAVTQYACSAAALAWIAERLAPTGWEWILAAMALGVVHLVIELPVPILRSLANHPGTAAGPWRQLLPSLAAMPLAAMAAGAVVLLVIEHGALGLVGYAPVALLLAMGQWLTATQQDRRRLNALYALALDTTDVTDEDRVYEAALDATRQIAGGARVQLLDDPGGDEAVSVRLAPGRWLVAARQSDSFTPDDEDLLAAVGRLATTSAHRVRLHGELERQERVKTALLAAAGHDLQTPLAVQLGIAETLSTHRDALDAEQVVDLVDRIAANARRMSRTIAGLVDLERLELSDGDAATCDAGAAVAEWAAQADLPNGRFLELDVGPARPDACVPLARVYLERIVENLVANAARYSPREEPITIRVRPDGSEVLLAVEDRGRGVREEDRERIFEALDQGTSSTRGSVGLGLFIVSRFVEHGGGSVSVHDRPGGGASFQVRLPVVEAAAPDDRPAAARAMHGRDG